MEQLRGWKVSKKAPIKGMALVYNKSQAQVWVFFDKSKSIIQIYNVNTFEIEKELTIENKKKKITVIKQIEDNKVWVCFSDGSVRIYNVNNYQYNNWDNACSTSITSVTPVPIDDTDFSSAKQIWFSEQSGSVSAWILDGDSISPIFNSDAHIHTQVCFMDYFYFTYNSIAKRSSPRLEDESLLDSDPQSDHGRSGKSDSLIDPNITIPYIISGDFDGRIIIWDPRVIYLFSFFSFLLL